VCLLGVATLVAVVIMGWSGGFVMLGWFSLLLKLAEVQDLRLAKLGEVLIEFRNYLRLFPD
jgi:hypothetical protein